MKSCFFLATVAAGTLGTPLIGAEPAFTVPLGQRQLFLDDYGIAKTENLKRTMHRPKKKGAVIRPDFAAGEKSIQTRSGPAWDEKAKVFKMWLISPVCYESRDGLHWTRSKPQPSLPCCLSQHSGVFCASSRHLRSTAVESGDS